MRRGRSTLSGSKKKAYATDLEQALQPLEPIEEVFATAREKIAREFASSAVEIAQGYLELAKRSPDDDVRRKASDRVLDTFIPVAGNAKLQQAPGTTIQILNAMPVPEVHVTGGKETQQLEIAGTRYALPAPTKRVITPGAEPKRRSDYLGPQWTKDKPGPTPQERKTQLPDPPA